MSSAVYNWETSREYALLSQHMEENYPGIHKGIYNQLLDVSSRRDSKLAIGASLCSLLSYSALTADSFTSSEYAAISSFLSGLLGSVAFLKLTDKIDCYIIRLRHNLLISSFKLKIGHPNNKGIYADAFAKTNGIPPPEVVKPYGGRTGSLVMNGEFYITPKRDVARLEDRL